MEADNYSTAPASNRWVPGIFGGLGFFYPVGRESSKSRYGLYIDGFNMYHAIKDSCPQYKWLNYRRLGALLIGPADTLGMVVYFTAYAKWKPASVARHMTYIKALRSANIEVVRGRFLKKELRCHRCGRTFWTHEEKRTDVNIALRMVADAVNDKYDKALVITADSDLMPVIETVHLLAPEKEIGIMFPIGRTSHDLRQHADFRRKMKENHLKASQFPKTIPVASGTIDKPITWA